MLSIKSTNLQSVLVFDIVLYDLYALYHSCKSKERGSKLLNGRKQLLVKLVEVLLLRRLCVHYEDCLEVGEI